MLVVLAASSAADCPGRCSAESPAELYIPGGSHTDGDRRDKHMGNYAQRCVQAVVPRCELMEH